MGPPPPPTFPILSFAFSNIILSNQPNPTFDVLSILSLPHTQSSATLTISKDNIPHPAPQITYPPIVSQITYPAQNSTNPQVKTEANPPLPPPPQIQEPRQQNEAFPTHGTILTITGGSNINFDTKRQRRDYYREVKHAAVKGPIT
jgi:hypothetical protein